MISAEGIILSDELIYDEMNLPQENNFEYNEKHIEEKVGVGFDIWVEEDDNTFGEDN